MSAMNYRNNSTANDLPCLAKRVIYKLPNVLVQPIMCERGLKTLRGCSACVFPVGSKENKSRNTKSKAVNQSICFSFHCCFSFNVCLSLSVSSVFLMPLTRTSFTLCRNTLVELPHSARGSHLSCPSSDLSSAASPKRTTLGG